MKIVVLMLIGIALSGCLDARSVEFYTKPEADAITARAQCRALARNVLQLARCDGR